MCPDALGETAEKVANTYPVDWYVRIQFDELLDPDAVEQLEDDLDADDQPTGQQHGTLVNTRPVSLSCNGVPIPYDGFYASSGNSLSWPLGPALYVAPMASSTVATGSECSISLDPEVVIDKDGVSVPQAQAGPYTFRIAPLEFDKTSPAALADPANPPTTLTSIDATAPVLVTFNAAIAAASLDPADVTIEEVTTCTDAVGIVRAVRIEAVTKDPQSIAIKDEVAAIATPANAWEKGKTYRVTIAAGAEVADRAGGTGAVEDELVLCFKTKA